MKKLKMLLVAIFGLFAFNIIAMAQCSDQDSSSNYSIEAADGTKYCSTLSEAFSEVKDNGVVKVLKNTNENSNVNMLSTSIKSFTIDLDGKTITFGGSASAGIIINSSKATLTIMDSSSNGKIINSIGPAVYDAIGNVVLESGTLSSSSSFSAIQVGQAGTTAKFTMNGGKVENNGSSNGSALFLLNGEAIVNNGTITNSNDITIFVGKTNETSGKLTINDGTIENTKSGDDSISILVNKGDLVVNNGNITSIGNSSTVQIGSPTGTDDVSLNFAGGKIENTGTGGAILIARGNSTISNGNAISNGTYSTIQVGSSKDYHGHLTISGGTVENKKNIPAIIVPYGGSDATINGGVIKINEDDTTSTNDTAIMIGMNPSDEETDKDYGSGAMVTINKGDITGGISLFGKQPELTISGGNITARSFAVSGNGSPEGSVNATIGSNIKITGGNLTSTSNAAIYHPQTGSLTISGGTITGKIGIVARQGNINITDGKITATGSADETIRTGDAKDENGYVQLPTGTAIIVDNSEENAYEGKAKVTISGEKAIIEGSNQSIISYKGNKKQDFEISGGTFLSNGIKDDVREYFNTDLYGQSQSGLVGIVHNIKFDYDHNQGSVESYTDATENEEVTFTVKPNEDYAVDSIEIKIEDNKNVQYTSSNNKHTFVMPEKDVTVSIKFKVLYADYSDLYEALLKAKGINTSKYTKESVKALLEAIANAEKIEKGLRASQQYRINNLTYALNNAIANLVLVNSNAVKPSEPIPDTYDNGSIYFGFAIITLGTMLISIKKLRNN